MELDLYFNVWKKAAGRESVRNGSEKLTGLLLASL